MQNTYLTALNGMPTMLLYFDNPFQYFKRGIYTASFESYYKANQETMQALEQGYQNAVDKEQFIYNMAEAIVQAGVEKFSQVKRKSQQTTAMMDLNISLVAFAFPALQEFKGQSGMPLIKEVIRQWKEAFPTANISHATFEEIEKGFHRKWCYITTAVCDTFGKPDDCYELNLLRDYRDGYLMSQEDGEQVIREYYDIAPTIVKHINRLPEKKEIYRTVWDAYLAPCISMIEQEKYAECKDLYIKMVRDLEEEYFMEYTM